MLNTPDMLLLFCLVGAANALYKQWIPDTNYENKTNWDKGAVPCGNDIVQFSAQRQVSVFVETTHAVQEMRMPVDGEFILNSGAGFYVLAGQEPGCGQGVTTKFKDSDSLQWFNPALWQAAATVDELQHGNFLFSVHEESVPCQYDDVVFKALSSFKVDTFSATCPSWVYDVAKKYMRPECKHVDLIGKKTQKAATTVEHLAIACHWSQRAAVIGDVIQVYSGSHGRTIVFCETKKDANELSMNASIKQSAQSLHGDIPQKQRELTLKGFRNGSFEVLVATNVAARGLDIPEVDLVIQCSPPKDVESYIHRSGRTGRAGRTGVCICFYQRKEEDQLRYVENKAGITFRRVGVPTANDIIKSSSKDAVRFLDSVPVTAIGYFRASAEKLIEERGAVDALAAALAHISGATSLEQRSLLNSDAGCTTMQLVCSQEMHNLGYAWRTIKEQLGEQIENHIQRMTFLKGKTGVCFDVPVDKVKEMQENWKDGRRWQLTVATELPELEEKQFNNRGDRGFGGGNRGDRGGGFRGGRGRNFGGNGGRGNGFRNGGGGYSNRGGHKRSFSQAFDY